MKKILVINHCDNFIYGAGRSLVNTLNNLQLDYDLVCPKTFLKKNNNIRNEFNSNLKNIYRIWLPFILCYDDATIIMSFKGRIYNKVVNLLFRIFYKDYKKLISSDEYEFIYLNSSVLYPLINENKKFLIHIREIISENKREIKKIKEKLKLARGIIFIDKATENPFKNSFKNSIIINNPFDMSKVLNLNKENIKKNLNLDLNTKIFSIIGNVIEAKGNKFVIEAFMKTKINAYLLVVGNSKSSYGKECRKISSEDSRIIFLDEIKEIEKIYRISDCIIRGEKYFCIGRTIFEGLYSGNNVIIPGNENDKTKIFDIDIFKDKIFMYTPKNADSLIKKIEIVFLKAEGQYIPKSSNIKEYVNIFLNYVYSIINILN